MKKDQKQNPKQRIINWFIHTNDAHTNEVISRELPKEDIADGLECADGVERQLWKCDGSFVTKMQKNKKSQKINFEIFKQEGKYGAIKKCDFFNKKKKHMIKKLSITTFILILNSPDSCPACDEILINGHCYYCGWPN